MNKCPTNFSGGNTGRQAQLSQGQYENIPAYSKNLIQKSSMATYRCNYCGCVYLYEASNVQELGFLDSGILGEGWHHKN